MAEREVVVLGADRKRVVLGNIAPESHSSHMVKSLVRTIESGLIDHSILGWGDHDLGKSRNLVVQEFLDGEGDQLWFVDSDMTWRVSDLAEFLARHQALGGVAGGVYRRPQWEMRDGTWRRERIEWDARSPLGGEFTDEASGLQPASYIGAGALLLPRAVLETVGRNWFTERGRGVAEDLSFCLRVHDSGLPVYADFGFRLGHVKSEVIY